MSFIKLQLALESELKSQSHCTAHKIAMQPTFNISTNKSVILYQVEFSFDYKNKPLLWGSKCKDWD